MRDVSALASTVASSQGEEELTSVPTELSQAGRDPVVPSKENVASSDDQFDEEDRLAFLRAQAAQDAALARLRSAGEPLLRPQGNGGSPQSKRSHHPASGNQNHPANARNNRRRRGGKFRGGQKNFQGRPSGNSILPQREIQEAGAEVVDAVVQPADDLRERVDLDLNQDTGGHDRDDSRGSTDSGAAPVSTPV